MHIISTISQFRRLFHISAIPFITKKKKKISRAYSKKSTTENEIFNLSSDSGSLLSFGFDHVRTIRAHSPYARMYTDTRSRADKRYEKRKMKKISATVSERTGATVSGLY